MIVLDVNVLVAAHLGAHPHHARALPFLTRELRTGAVVIPDLVWVGFIRIVTNRRIFESPSTPEQATAFVRDVLASPGYRTPKNATATTADFLDLVQEFRVAANLVPDAYIASVARALGCAVATFDTDFRRFDGLHVITP